MLKAVLVIACLASVTTQAGATEPPNTLTSVAELSSMCTAAGTTTQEARDGSALICWGYMRGVLGSYAELRDEATERRICIPDGGIDDLRLTNTFLEWTSRNPESRGMPAARGVYMAMSEAFPCSQ